MPIIGVCEAADRVCSIIEAHAAGRRYDQPGQFRNWITVEFGVEVKCFKSSSDVTAFIPATLDYIALNIAHAPYKQVFFLLHELAEWIQIHEQLFDDAPKVSKDCEPVLFRHEVACAVVKQMRQAWGLDQNRCSLSPSSLLRCFASVNESKYSRLLPITQYVDPFEDTCL